MNKTIPHQLQSQAPGFTLIELLVIVAMLGLFSLCLAPALCRSKSQTKVAACAANFRQWALSATMYAKDNRDLLPSLNFTYGGGGNYIWNVATNMCTVLGRYQLAVPNWYCPVRPNELDTDRASFQSWQGRPMSTIDDLQLLFNHNGFNESIIHDNFWVQRAGTGGTVFPTDWSQAGIWPVWAKGTPSQQYGWPTRLDDRAAVHVPFVSDECGSGQGNGLSSPPQGIGYTSTNISPNTAHFFGGRLNGVNAAYVDGHVEMHNPATINCGYSTGSGNTYWFY
jgi:prepilin-type processing-associated H-X9-DG protein